MKVTVNHVFSLKIIIIIKYLIILTSGQIRLFMSSIRRVSQKISRKLNEGTNEQVSLQGFYQSILIKNAHGTSTPR
jgi:hypothetical protein